MLWLFFIVKCGIVHFLCAMRVFEVRASSSSPRLPLCQISFVSRLHYWTSPWRIITYSINQSLIHSINQWPSLFDTPGTEALALLKNDLPRLSNTEKQRAVVVLPLGRCCVWCQQTASSLINSWTVGCNGTVQLLQWTTEHACRQNKKFTTLNINISGCDQCTHQLCNETQTL